MIVVADTGPINYLLLIQQIDLLPKLYKRVVVPAEVHTELLSLRAPDLVRQWASAPPEWFNVNRSILPPDPRLSELDTGERAALGLAFQLQIAAILIDDLDGRKLAATLGLEVSGTLGTLKKAAALGLVDINAALDRLLATNFRISRELLASLRS